MALIVEIKVVPLSAKNSCKLESGRLKCYLKSPALKNKANNELIGMLAKALKIPIHHISIVTGQTTRLKRLKIDATITFEQLLQALGVEYQIKIF